MKELRIIYVEDDENDVMLLRHVLRKAGVSIPIQHVPDGETAIEYLSGQGKYRDRDRYPLPHLMLMDIKMPGRDGLSVLKWIRSQRELCSLVVIVFSSSDLDTDVRRAYECGANSYLVKPNGLESQMSLVRALQSYWVEHNQFAPPRRSSRDHLVEA